MPFELKSSVFENNETIPVTYTCDAQNVSPPLSWEELPERTQSLALICEDPDAPQGTFCHWIIFNIPPNFDGLPENLMPGEQLQWGGIQGQNDLGQNQYDGPCPPPGEPHHYHFRLWALDGELEIDWEATREEFLQALRGKILESTELVGLYRRQK
jgi:hypothetical protein